MKKLNLICELLHPVKSVCLIFISVTLWHHISLSPEPGGKVPLYSEPPTPHLYEAKHWASQLPVEVAGWENHNGFQLESLGQLNRSSLISESYSKNEWARPASQEDTKVPPQGSWPSQKRKFCSYPLMWNIYSTPPWCTSLKYFYDSSLN